MIKQNNQGINFRKDKDLVDDIEALSYIENRQKLYIFASIGGRKF